MDVAATGAQLVQSKTVLSDPRLPSFHPAFISHVVLLYFHPSFHALEEHLFCLEFLCQLSPGCFHLLRNGCRYLLCAWAATALARGAGKDMECSGKQNSSSAGCKLGE